MNRSITITDRLKYQKKKGRESEKEVKGRIKERKTEGEREREWMERWSTVFNKEGISETPE
jgi:hypothetical protein